MADDIQPAALVDGWAVASPESVGLDGDLLRGIGPHFESWTDTNAHAILIVRQGKLVYERYFTGEDWAWGTALGRVAYGATKRHDLRSVTRSAASGFTSCQARGLVVLTMAGLYNSTTFHGIVGETVLRREGDRR